MHIATSVYQDALLLLLGDNSNRSRELVSKLVEIGNKSDVRHEITTQDDDLADVYKSLIKSILSEPAGPKGTVKTKVILLKIKTDTTLQLYPSVRDILTDIVSTEEPLTAEQIDSCIRNIRSTLVLSKLDDTTRSLFAKTSKISDISNVNDRSDEIERLTSSFEQMLHDVAEQVDVVDDKNTDSFVSLTDEESMLRSLQAYEDRNVRGVFPTGLQGLNRALGARGGAARGEIYVFAALSHHFKSGMLLLFVVWIILYGKFVTAIGRKPLLYFISLENDVSNNLVDIFYLLYVRIEKKNINKLETPKEFIIEWLTKFMATKGIDVMIDRYQPHDFSYGRYVQRINHFESLGYEVIVTDLDYLNEVRGIDNGDTISTQGQIQLTRENYIKFRGHCNAGGYLFVTGHQLTRKAAEVAALHRQAVKKFDFSHMADSSDVYRIIDCLVFQHLEKNLNGVKFLTCNLVKNRGCQDTPDKDKFFAYPFTEFGIEDDIEGLPKYVTDIDAYDSGTKESETDEVDMMF